ncbi:butyrophilin subfamily 3 member A3-like isoform X2 [Pristis pectinata]|nr:butyrophilin subfamily 3 member A3-like isoform X2 [Pristis pectinata]XP_051899769.1 butyrophilin subfamily 3 member A3-like isoform X2 [Pristis pectinata]XP_051899770.1 butyrophilin subfamily 3 member A3-like isoform X2 [Pristis pectinata]XP_051899771.1 butyrophilin subfamily 3 member A3-like isoform X2 [Pristis pectinata]
MLISYWNTANLELFRVKGPDHPTVALVGASAVLNCTVVSPIQDRGWDFEWRNLRTQDVILTCDDQGEPCQSFRDGTHLFGDQLEAGNVSVRLEGIRASDAGRYQCTVFSGTHTSSVVMDLSVVALGTKPSVSIEQFNESSFLYTCRSEGWFPEPAIIWKDSEGKSLLPLSTVTKTTDEEGLYRLEVQHWTAQGVPTSVTCIVHNRVNNVKKVSTACTREQFPYSQFHVGETEWRHIQSFSVSLRLDADTANPWLALSEDLISVVGDSLHHPVPSTPNRLQLSPCVLASRGFSSGRAYWEAEVAGNPAWELGLLGEKAHRKAGVEGLAGISFWALSRLGEMEYRAVGSPGQTLVLSEEPTVVGLYLIHQPGRLSFFDADRQLHLSTVTVDPTDRLYPIFCPAPWDRQRPAEPLRLRRRGP